MTTTRNEMEANDFPVLVVTFTCNKRELTPTGPELPFYDEPMPLTYKVFMKSIFKHSIPKGHYVLVMDFGNFTNVFVYSDEMRSLGLACSAKTFDTSKTLLAEATMIGHGLKVVEIEEVHYDKDGHVQFRCKSEIVSSLNWERSDAGQKCRESDVQGKKVRDYYFLWPVDLF